MSISAVGFAFTQRLPATQKWLLVCLADIADAWGDSIFVSLEELSERTSLSRATLQRAFRELLASGVIVRVARSTPFSPPFYRIVMPEPPPGTKPQERECSNALRAAVKYAFHHVCEYCHRPGTPDRGPDGHRWTVDRLVPGKDGGRYVPGNVTLACRFCNTKKRTGPAPAGTRTLEEVEAQVSKVGHQNDASVLPDPDRPSDAPEASGRGGGGITARPDPLLDPITDPLEDSAGAPPPRPRQNPEPERPERNIRVITKIAHEAIAQLGPHHEDLVETVKSLCAQRDIRYNSAVVLSALDSARWQRTHPTPEVH
jgi:hypothetical protein